MQSLIFDIKGKGKEVDELYRKYWLVIAAVSINFHLIPSKCFFLLSVTNRWYARRRLLFNKCDFFLYFNFFNFVNIELRYKLPVQVWNQRYVFLFIRSLKNTEERLKNEYETIKAREDAIIQKENIMAEQVKTKVDR